MLNEVVGEVPRLAIVVPCYNEESALPETARQLLAVLGRLRAAGKIAPGSAAWFVDDGSGDGTWEAIERLAEGHPGQVQGIKLSRNRGHQNALMAGLFTAEGDILVSMDADLQDDPNIIEAMVDEYRGGTDVVYGVRSARPDDSFFKRTSARGFYRLMQAMGAELVYDHADFRLLSRRAVEALKTFPERNLFLRGIVPLVGFRSAIVRYQRGDRVAGQSKYPAEEDDAVRHRRHHILLDRAADGDHVPRLRRVPGGAGDRRLGPGGAAVHRWQRAGMGVDRASHVCSWRPSDSVHRGDRAVPREGVRRGEGSAAVHHRTGRRQP